jgi:hypothetical protein
VIGDQITLPTLTTCLAIGGTQRLSFINRDDVVAACRDGRWGMNLRRRSVRIVALAVVVALPLLGTSSVAAAKVKAGCHKTKSCHSSGAGGTGVGVTTPGPMTVQIDPNPAVETSASIIDVIQVETSPSFAGDLVDISSSQFAASCGPGFAGFDTFYNNPQGPDNVEVPLDDDGNATVLTGGTGCAPGSSVVEADLLEAPYYTALATLVTLPPVVTTPGLTGYPASSGTVTGGEVETGDTGAPLEGSFVFAVFNVETDPVYAEQPVEISSAQLQARCGTSWVFGSFGQPQADSFGAGPTLEPGSPATATTTLDDDGNAQF